MMQKSQQPDEIFTYKAKIIMWKKEVLKSWNSQMKKIYDQQIYLKIKTKGVSLNIKEMLKEESLEYEAWRVNLVK